MNEYIFDEFKKIILEMDGDLSLIDQKTLPDFNDLKNTLETKFHSKENQKYAVLGIDIYQYSQYEEFEQKFIPLVFRVLFQYSIKKCLRSEKFLFSKIPDRESFMQKFIDTGDGGFQIFETPLHAMTFVINFSVYLRAYNSYHFFPKLRSITGELSLRYTITYDTLYKMIYKNGVNYYGSAIINNARLLSKDSLNRFLIDEATYRWFLININGVENLQILDQEMLKIIPFNEYDLNILEEGDKNSLFHSEKNTVQLVDIQKIGTITAKKQELSVYNIHLKIAAFFERDGKKRQIMITIGNLNVHGIM